MIIKRYTAGSMPEAMERIKRELGSDAVILSTRTIPRSGWRRFLGSRQLEVTAALEQVAASKEETGDLRHEVQELRQLVNELKELPRQRQPLPSTFVGWQELLLKMEIDDEVGAELVAGLGEPGGGQEKEMLVRRIANFLEGRTSNPQERIHCFVGPTGVGKTTTLAKLAAHAALFDGRKTAVITADTYRIGAVGQLRTYADILNIPLEVVMTPQEMEEALQLHGDKDAIFIDTAGRPSSNTEQLAELNEMLMVIPQKTISLVLSCATKNTDMLKIVKDFQIADYDQLIFTKADETSSLGNILSITTQTGYPVAYVTVGQNVPDDIVMAEPKNLAELMVGALSL